MDDAARYRKCSSAAEANAIPRGQWEPIARNGAPTGEIAEAATLLVGFEGCWVRADGIICELRELKVPPGWTLLCWKDSWHWCTLGRCFTIYLPLAAPPL